MLSKFFKAMSENPSKDDWSEQVKVDLEDLGIREDLSKIEVTSKASFKKTVKSKIYEYALDQLNMEKFSHSKMDNVVYPELKMQDYLLSEDISTAEKINLFHFRTRMASFSDNYRDGSNQPSPCKMCAFHRDCQEHSVTCHATMGKYSEI